MPLEIGNTRELATALAEKKLAVAGYEAVTAALRYVFMVIGLRPQNLPTGLDKDFIHAFILKNFGHVTAAEVRLAFDLAMTGRLDLDPRDLSCYENFTVAYFGRIMVAYAAWARETYKLLPDKVPPAKKRTAAEEAAWKLDLNLGFALYLLNQVNKLPCRVAMIHGTLQWTP